MRISIRNKLIATYLLISIFTALLIYLLTYFTSEQRVNALALDYQTAEMTEEAQHWYAAQKNWEGFAEYFKSMHPPLKGQVQTTETPSQEKSKKHTILDKERRALLNYLKYKQGDIVPAAYLAKATPILYQEETVGWIIPPDAVGISLKSEMMVFFDNVNEILIIAVVISIISSLLMGMILARIFLKPVESLTKAAADISSGRLEQQVLSYTDNEIGELSQTFNKMSSELVKADQQRRQLTADVTHDLGTPVQVISGYIEMAQEGGLELNAERIEIISSELEQINRLLKDMSLLAETDARTLSLQLAPTRIKPILERVLRLYQQACSDKNIQLSMQCEEALPELLLDEERMMQVLGNLLTNALRYTPENGSISISAYKVDNQLEIRITDTGSGIKAKDLPFIFDRFYRGNSSRSGTSGKMGLGLAISKSLIEMLGGKINAYSDAKGTRFIIAFPVPE